MPVRVHFQCMKNVVVGIKNIILYCSTYIFPYCCHSVMVIKSEISLLDSVCLHFSLIVSITQVISEWISLWYVNLVTQIKSLESGWLIWDCNRLPGLAREDSLLFSGPWIRKGWVEYCWLMTTLNWVLGCQPIKIFNLLTFCY